MTLVHENHEIYYDFIRLRKKPLLIFSLKCRRLINILKFLSKDYLLNRINLIIS